MTKMIKTSSILLVLGLLLTGCLLGCKNASNRVGVDEKEIQGFKTKTFFNEGGNVEVTIATDGKTTVVAVPKTTISRQNHDLSCLAKCRAIDDLESV